MIYSQLDNPVQWLTDTAVKIGGTVKNNRLFFGVGSTDEGSIQLFPLEKGLVMILTEVKSNFNIPKLQQFLPSDCLFMKLYLPHYHLETTAKVELEYQKITTPGVLLYNSHLKLKSLFKLRQSFKVASFAMHADWLKQTFHDHSIFSERRLFEIPLFAFKRIAPAILQSALNLFTLKPDSGLLHLKMKATAYDILSQLFLAFDLKEGANLSVFKHQDDVETVFRIRELLLDNEEMNYPMVDALARQAAMSTSKLKTLFRSVFGISIYEFYQHNRLEYARLLIEGRKLTVGEVGLKIGYNNLSKFSQAYKKKFGYLPSQTLLPDRAII